MSELGERPYETSITKQFERQANVSLVNGVVTISVDQDGYFTLTTP